MPPITTISLGINILYLIMITPTLCKIYKMNNKLKKYPEFIPLVYNHKMKIIFVSGIILSITLLLKDFSYKYIILGIFLFLIELLIEKILKKSKNINRLFIYEVISEVIILIYSSILTIEFYVRGM